MLRRLLSVAVPLKRATGVSESGLSQIMLRALAGVLVVLTAGCRTPAWAPQLYLHDAGRKQAVDAAIVEWAKLREASVPSRMVEVEAVQQNLSRETNALIRGQVELQEASDLQFVSWMDLRKRTREVYDEIASLLDRLPGLIADEEVRLAESLSELLAERDRSKDLVAAMNAVARSEARFRVQREFLAMILVSEARREGVDRVRLREFLERETEVDVFRMTDGRLSRAAGTRPLREVLVGLETELPEGNIQGPAGALALLELGLGVLREDGAPLAEVGLLEEHPGLRRTVVSLGLDLAAAAQERARARIGVARRRIGELRGAEILARRVRRNLMKDLEVSDGEIGLCAWGLARSEVDVGSTLRALAGLISAGVAGAESELVGVYLALLSNSRSRTDGRLLLDLDFPSLGLLDSQLAVEEAAANLRAREALITRGLDGLTAYYSGGISPEDIGRLIQLAATAALFDIRAEQ